MARWVQGLLLTTVVGALFVFPVAGRAENVDLSTVPVREGVQLTIYNGEDLTLVRDLRKVTFKKGNNPLQFSWAGTKIDPTSVQIRFVTQPDKLEVVDTTFPHAKPYLLQWQVASEFEGEVGVEISYFTSGIHWTADYVVQANEAETHAQLDGYVRIQNDSGEEYEGAEVRLIVGKINLVERLEQLVTDRLDRNDESKSKDEAGKKEKFNRRQVVERFFDALEADMDGNLGAFGARGGEVRSKQVAKESLSEYFLFTIEGTETIPNGWSKRLRSVSAKDVPIEVQYRYRPAEYGEQLVRMYLLRNDEPSHLGSSPLPDGNFRVFRDNGRDGLAYLTTQNLRYTPIGDRVELNLGNDPQVILELTKLRTSRDKLWLQIHGAQTLIEIGKAEKVVRENASVVGWDEHEVFAERIRNFSGKPIQVEIRRTLPGHVVFRSQLMVKLFDFQTVELSATVPASKKVQLPYEVVRKQGTNSKQNNITLEASEVLP
ncbi:MAG: hypothetical protein U0894_17120 [Pirellulales bacterium]